tara:strand:+ start:4331 stop:4633 length:303 start_codon:yes stop_codon:yes gene_type:complete
MLSLKDLIIFILIFIFIYLIFEYFFSLSPKIIEAGFQLDESLSTISFKDIPSMFDINLSQVNDLSIIQNQIKQLTKIQAANSQVLKSLKRQFSDETHKKS